MSANRSFPARQTHRLQRYFWTAPVSEAELPLPALRTGRLQILFPDDETNATEDIADIKQWCLARADEWYARGELGAARDFLNHAATVDPNDVPVWLALGSLQNELGELEHAGLAFHKAGELTPTDARVFLHLGLVHQQLQNHEVAEALFKHALVLAPDYTLAMNLLGLALMAADRHAEAGPLFANALAHQPGDIETLLRLGVCSFKVKDSDAACAHYEQVLKLSPGHALATENLAALKMLCGSAA